jgi:hypothetical protein
MSNARNPGVALTLSKAAARGNMGVSTLRQKLAKRIGPKAYKRPGSNRWLIYPDDFDTWANAHVVSPGVLPEPTEDPV